MPNTHAYNQNVYFFIRTINFVLMVIYVLTAVSVTSYSALGVIYNPIFRMPNHFLNYILNVDAIPSSIAELSSLYSPIGFDNIGKMLVGALYLAIASFCTFYLLIQLFGYLYNRGEEKALKYKLGEKGLEEYKKEIIKQERLESDKNKSLSDFESAQKEYWSQWNKFYSSNLSYEEWKDKVLNK